jgi:hypothetical protein
MANGGQIDAGFDESILEPIANWQKGWRENQGERERIAADLMAIADKIPSHLKQCDLECHRVVFLRKRDLVPLVFESRITDVLSSWTTDRNFAQRFKGAFRQEAIGFIFTHKPAPGEVVLNFSKLWSDGPFLAAFQSCKSRGESSCEILEHFRDSQSEVILNAGSLMLSEITGLSGQGDFDRLCGLLSIHDEANRDAFWKNLVGQKIYVGEPVWVSGQGALNVVNRVLDFAENLLDRVKAEKPSRSPRLP